MSSQTVARRYASALADVVIERKEEREVQKELEYWASTIEATPLLKEVFNNPTIPYEKKRLLVEDLISKTAVRETTASFLRVLLKNQRLSQLRDIVDRLALVLDERSGIVAADVITAHQISDHLQTTVRDALTDATGRKVRLSFTIDEEILGGVIARIGSTIFDGSIRSQLERLAVDLAGR